MYLQYKINECVAHIHLNLEWLRINAKKSFKNYSDIFQINRKNGILKMCAVVWRQGVRVSIHRVQ